MPIRFYVDANGVTYALGEMTNGICVVGVAVDGASLPERRRAPAKRS